MIHIILIFIFIYMLCLYYNIYFDKVLNIHYKVPKFYKSFKPINNFNWETSELNFILLIKLFGIFLLSKKNIFLILLYIYLLETLLLILSNSSSFVLHPLICIIFYFLIKI